MLNIDSKNNLSFKKFHSLLKAKGIKKEKQYIVSGQSIVDEYLTKYKSKIQFIIDYRQDKLEALDTNFKCCLLNKELYKELDHFGTNSSLLICNQNEIPMWDSQRPANNFELLVALGEPSNLGALVRNLTALNINKIILLKEACSPYHPKSVRAASGCLELMNFEFGPSILDLKDRSDLIALDMSGESIKNKKWNKNNYIILGEEGPGIPKDNHWQKLSIPMNSEVESLNATMAASFIAFHYFLNH